MNEDDFQLHSLHTLVFRSLKKSHDMYLKSYDVLPEITNNNKQFIMKVKAKSMFGPAAEKPHPYKPKSARVRKTEMLPLKPSMQDEEMNEQMDYYAEKAITPTVTHQPSEPKGASVVVNPKPIRSSLVPTPKWHPPWKLYRVLAGHLGWVRSIAVEPGNEWFATGAADRIIKVWDLASGRLKVSLTGHVSTVRGLAVSHRHPYLFSCGEDRQVKCWDLEYNKVIRHYHGHLSAVHTLTLHPSIDVLISAGRDSTARVWDMRTKANVHILTGHTNTISSVISQSAEPQVITGSHDSTVRLWDIAAGKTMATLTHHKKAIRSVVFHPSLYMFASASPDNIKQWKCPAGKYVQSLTGHNSIVNALAVNEDGVLVSGGDNGSMYFWDWKTGYNFQNLMTPVQPGSMDNESGIFALAFDLSGSRLITAEADKTVKIYKEDESATEDTHPVRWTPQFMSKRRF